MEEIILKNYETFYEIPNALLLVKHNSNLMYVRVGRNCFIAREFIDSVEFENEYIKYVVSYFNVKDNENILTLNIKRNVNDQSIQMSNQTKNIDIVPLKDILNIKYNKATYLSLQDINNIVDFKGEFVPGKKTSII